MQNDFKDLLQDRDIKELLLSLTKFAPDEWYLSGASHLSVNGSHLLKKESSQHFHGECQRRLSGQIIPKENFQVDPKS